MNSEAHGLQIKPIVKRKIQSRKVSSIDREAKRAMKGVSMMKAFSSLNAEPTNYQGSTIARGR